MKYLKQEHHWNLIDKVKRKYFLKYEIIRRLMRFFIFNNFNSPIFKLLVYMKLNKYTRFSILPNSKNRCVLSGRNCGVLSLFGLSRFFLRQESHKMNTFGFRRLSW